MLYPNNTTKQIVSKEIEKKIKLLEEANERNASEISNVGDAVNSLGDRTSAAEEDIADVKGAVETINGEIDDINDALEGKQNTLVILDDVREHSNNPVKSSGIYNALQEKIDTNKIKDNPEPNGTDVLSTGGAYDIVQDIGEQLDEMQEEITEAGLATVDEVPTEDSRALVRSGGIYDAIENAKEAVKEEVVTGVKGGAEYNYRKGNVTITKDNIGLSNVNNTSDMAKPVSTAQATAISNAVTNAINALDVSEVGGDGEYIKAIKETDGKISATVETMDSTPTEGSSKAVTSGGIKTALDGKQNTLTAGANIKIDNNVIEGTSDLPTDAVLHYSFDELPDYPDGTAIGRNLNGDTYNVAVSSAGTITTDAYAEDGKIHKSNVSGNANYKTNVGSNRSLGVYFGITSGTGLIKIIEFNAKTPNLDVHIFYRQTSSSQLETIYPLGHSIPIGKHRIVVFVPQNCFEYSIVFYSYDSDLNYTEWELTSYYLGDGSYSTPIIDNANGQNNATNNGGIAVQGVSGKGVHFFKGKYVNASADFQFTENFSCSIWCRPEDFSTNCQILRKQGVITLVIVEGILRCYLYDNNGNELLSFFSLSPMTINQFTHIVIVRNDLSFKYYKNGVLTKTSTLANATIQKNNNILTVGSDITKVIHTEDDLLIFDRALTETEVKALYNNKANTPKYFLGAGTQIIPIERVSDTGSIQELLDINWTDVDRGNVHTITAEIILQAAISAGYSVAIDLEDITGIKSTDQRQNERFICYAVRKYYNASASVNIVQCLLHRDSTGWKFTFLDAIPADGDTWEITPIIISM